MGPRATKDVVEWLLGQLEGDEEALIESFSPKCRSLIRQCITSCNKLYSILYYYTVIVSRASRLHTPEMQVHNLQIY